MSEKPEEKTNIVQLPVTENQPPVSDAGSTPAAEQTESQKPKTIQDLVASVDLTNVTHHEIIRDLVGGIQDVAVRATIALGLLERLEIENNKDQATS